MTSHAALRILFLTQTYPRFDSDTAGPFIRDLARGLVAAGDQVTVLTPHAPDVRAAWTEDGVTAKSFRYAPDRLEVLGYGRSLDADEIVKWRAGLVTPLYATAARRAMQKLTSRNEFDLIHAHWVVPNGLIAASLGWHGVLAVGLHGSDVFLAEKPGMRRLVGRAMRRAQLLTGCSPELVDRVCSIGFDRQQSHVIPYGVDTEKFSPTGGDPAVWRSQLGVPPQSPLVLSVGRMATKKGFHVLLREMPGLMTRFPKVHWVFAGDGDRLAEFRELAAEWEGRVHFPGAVLRDTLPDLYRAADIFVLPAVHDSKGNVDGLPNVILEAMASGLPVVASGISGIPLAVTDGEEGLLVEEQQGAQLAHALQTVLQDAPRRRLMGAAARRKAERELTWKAVAARYHGAYEETLDRVASSRDRKVKY